MQGKAEIWSFCDFPQYFNESNNAKVSHIQQKRVNTAKIIQVTRKMERQTEGKMAHWE